MGSKLGVLIALIVVLSVPFLVRGLAGASARDDAAFAGGKDVTTLVVVTPHVEQIQWEFSRAFARWHQRVHGRPARIDWRTPGGTSEIVKQLEASFDAAARKGLLRDDGSFPPGAAGFDLFFGGGSFEHGKMREPKTVTVSGSGRSVTYRMGRPAGFTKPQLDEWFGENKIGVQTLYDPDQYWIGTALSGFGIVYNRDVLKTLGLPEPRKFTDLCDPRYVGNLGMTDGRLSGSVTTTYDSILNKEGWDKGWRTLREMAANARYFASAATRPPIDVGQGEAAAGLSIDFYGRGQAQFLLRTGQEAASGRVGYVDPEGAVYIDADPASILNGASDPDLAKRFIEFCLSEEGQALWQFHARAHELAGANPPGPDGKPMGPERYELRRMPVRRLMYEKHLASLIDKSDPFKAASDVPGRGWRSAIGPMMAAFGIDTRPELTRAWRTLIAAREKAGRGAFPMDALAQMESLFYAMPRHTLRPGSLYADPGVLGSLAKPARDELTRLKITTFDELEQRLANIRAGKAPPEVVSALAELISKRPSTGQPPAALELSEQNFRAVRADTDSWRDPVHGRLSLIAYTRFFRENYRRVSELGAAALD